MFTRLFQISCGAILAGFLLSLPAPSQAAQCLQDFRTVKGGGHNMRLRDYLCRTNDNRSVRVQFHRVTDHVANAVLSGNLPAGISNIFGKPRLIDNDVHQEFNTLMKRFGTYNSHGECVNFQVISAGQGQGIENSESCSDKAATRRSIGGWAEDKNVEPSVFPAPDDLRSLEFNSTVPRGYKSKMATVYGERVKTIWRYAKRKDFKNSTKRMKAYNKLVTKLKTDREGVMENKYFDMLDYITRKGVPKKFMVIHGASQAADDCQGYAARWVLEYTERAMMVDLAVIENTSARPVTIGQLLGAKGRKTKLRSLSKSKALRKKTSASLGLNELRLAAGERALLFQRMAFFVPKSKKAGYKLPGYVYGPEVLLKGLEIGGERLDFEGQSANFISLTAGDEGGSCPYLHAWSDKLNAFVNTGKMLNEAKGAALKQSDTRSFAGFKSRFRIHEQEPELAHIDQVALMVELNSGDKHVLKPDNEKLASRDRLALKLGYGEYVEFRFKLPHGIKETQVARSTITLTGYYERYSTLMKMSRLKRPLELLVKVAD